MGDIYALHFAQVVRAGVNQLDRYDAILQNELLVINIFQKKVKGPQSLFYSLFDEIPFRGSDDPGNNIKGKYFFYSLTAGIHGEGDSLAHEQSFG